MLKPVAFCPANKLFRVNVLLLKKTVGIKVEKQPTYPELFTK